MPSKCYARRIENGVVVHSLIPAEHDIIGIAADVNRVLAKVTFSELLNPCARGFRALEINPKAEVV